MKQKRVKTWAVLALLTSVSVVFSFPRDSIKTVSFFDNATSISFGSNCMLSTKLYPAVTAELYISVIGFRGFVGPIYNTEKSSVTTKRVIGTNYGLGICHHTLFRIRHSDNGLRYLIIEPSLLTETHSISILGNTPIKYNFVSTDLRFSLAANHVEIFYEPKFILSAPHSVKLNSSMMHICGINFHIILSK